VGVPAESFESLFTAHARALLAYALRRVERAEDAADVVSETMLVAWRRLDDVPAGAEARPWLFGVARNVLTNQRRSKDRGGRLGAKLRTHLADLVHRDHSDDVGTTLVVRTAMDHLNDEDREILRLTAWEGLTPSELAIAMSIPAPTARSRLHRARGRLRTELERLGWAGHEDDDERVLVRRKEGES
jgi:RNA polymerase sigma-70 factor, ECF subfamily